MTLTTAVFSFSIATDRLDDALRRLSAAFLCFHSALLIARYPWNPLGTCDYSIGFNYGELEA